MANDKEDNKIIEKKLDVVIELMQQLVAIELYRSDVTQGAIGKRLHIAKKTVGEILKGVKKDQ